MADYAEASAGNLTLGFTPEGGDGTDTSHFGWSSDIAGDWLMIGEPRADDGRGAVRSYKRINGNWTYQNKIVASDRDSAIADTDAANRNDVTNSWGFFGWSISMLDAGSEGIFMIIGAPGIQDDVDYNWTYHNITKGAIYFYNKPQNSDTWTEIKDKDLAGNILTRANISQPDYYHETTYQGWPDTYTMGWDVKLSKISNYIIAFVSCPVGSRGYARNLGNTGYSEFNTGSGTVVVYYYHRTRDQFVLVRYDNEETLTTGNRWPKPVHLKHGLGTNNHKKGGNARGNLLTLHVDDSSTQKWLFVGFPSDVDAYSGYSRNNAAQAYNQADGGNGRVEVWDISENGTYTETGLVLSGTTDVISIYSDITANCGFPYFLDHRQINEYHNSNYVGYSYNGDGAPGSASGNHKRYFMIPFHVGLNRWTGNSVNRAGQQGFGMSIATTVVDGTKFLFIGHVPLKFATSRGLVHVWKLLIPDPSNTNEPSHAVPSLVPATSSNPGVRMEGVFDSPKGRWQYWQSFNRPDFDEVQWNDPPPNASYNTVGGGPSPLAGEINGFDDLFGYTIKTSGKNVFVSAPGLSHAKGKVYVFTYNSTTGYFTTHDSNYYGYKGPVPTGIDLGNYNETALTPQSATKEFLGDVSYNTFGKSISIYGTGGQQELIITASNGVYMPDYIVQGDHRRIVNKKTSWGANGTWIATRTGLHPNILPRTTGTYPSAFLAGYVKQITIYDTAFDTDASNNGISQSDITTLKSVNFGTVTSGLGNPDATTKAKLKAIVDGASDVADKRKKIRSSLRLLFAQDTTVKKMVVDKDDIGLGKKFIKSKVLIVKAGETFDVEDLSQNEGFYSTLNTSETFSVKLKNTTATFTRTDDSDGNELYYLSVTNNNFDKLVMNTDGVTGTFRKNNVNGTLKPDDELILDGRRFVISSVADGGAAGSGGDPYIYPINSNVPVKLPDKTAFYRMFEQGNNFINVSVEKASSEHQQRMKDFVKKVAPNAKNVVTDGFFYKYCFIHAEGHEFIMDYSTKNIYTSEEDMLFFNIKQTVEMFDCGEFKEAAVNYQISWMTNTGDKIVTQLLFFRNPHMENGIKVIPETTFRSTGLIVENYKPELMELPELTTTKYSKIWRDLYKTKNKYQNKNIKEKNEKWYFN